MGTEGIQDKYVNPYTDFGFKLLFGTAVNKELLISFLNALLFKEEVIKDVLILMLNILGRRNMTVVLYLMYIVRMRRARSSWLRCSVASSSFSRTAVSFILLSPFVSRPNAGNGIMS